MVYARAYCSENCQTPSPAKAFPNHRFLVEDYCKTPQWFCNQTISSFSFSSTGARSHTGCSEGEWLSFSHKLAATVRWPPRCMVCVTGHDVVDVKITGLASFGALHRRRWNRGLSKARRRVRSASSLDETARFAMLELFVADPSHSGAIITASFILVDDFKRRARCRRPQQSRAA